MSDTLRSALAAAKPKAVIGSGILTVNGSKVAILHGVSYDGSLKYYEHILGAHGGKVQARYATEMDAALKADYADVLGNIALFTLNSTSAPSSGPLPVYSAKYEGVNGITIEFASCNIIPGGVKMVAGEWVSGQVEIRTVGGVLPTITDAGLA